MQKKSDFHSYEIYTDGGCLPNGRGAWAFIILDAGCIISEKSGTEFGTTCVRMEIKAAIEALKSLPLCTYAKLWTDSRVLLEIIHPKLKLWKSNNWRRARGQKVIDLDLVQSLDLENSSRSIDWQWVRAHSGNPFNDGCDELCRKELGLPPKSLAKFERIKNERSIRSSVF